MRNAIVLTGDVHSSWAFDVPRNPWDGYSDATGGGSLAYRIDTSTPIAASVRLVTSQRCGRRSCRARSGCRSSRQP